MFGTSSLTSAAGAPPGQPISATLKEVKMSGASSPTNAAGSHTKRKDTSDEATTTVEEVKRQRTTAAFGEASPVVPMVEAAGNGIKSIGVSSG